MKKLLLFFIKKKVEHILEIMESHDFPFKTIESQFFYRGKLEAYNEIIRVIRRYNEPYLICVICKDLSDYEKTFPNKEEWITDNIIYLPILNVNDVRLFTFDEIIETECAKENKNYEEIKSLINLNEDWN